MCRVAKGWGKSNEDLKEYNDEVKSKVDWSWNQLKEEERVLKEQIRASSKSKTEFGCPKSEPEKWKWKLQRKREKEK